MGKKVINIESMGIDGPWFIPKNYTGIVNASLTKMSYHYENGILHNDHGPAVWAQNGELKIFCLYNKQVDFKTFELHFMLKYNKIYYCERS